MAESSMIQWLNLIGWGACVIYTTIPAFWLMIHPRVDYWRSRRRSPFLALLPLWIAMWIVLGLLTVRWRHASFYTTGWTRIPAALLFLTGLWLYSRAGKKFSLAQLGGMPEILLNHGEQKLVMVGIRSHVRHPIYLAHLCEMLAWSIGTGLAVCYGLTTFAVLTGAAMIRLEDRELEQRFGEPYRDYRQKVPAILPWI
jgi:protein-S-isoprenylcysteine O-methyltransferase Ste14